MCGKEETGMKKIITVFCGTLLAAVLMLSMAACGGNGGGKNLIDSDTNTKITYSVQEIADLSGWDLEGSIDSLGFCVFSKYNTDNAENEYMLYNLITAEKYVSAEEFSKISDGLYYTGQESADAMSYTFNYYGKGGSAKTYTVTYNESDPDSSMEEANNAQYALFADKTFLYVSVKGEIATGTRNLTPVLTYEDMENTFKVGEYYLNIGDLDDINMVQIFDESGAYVKSYNVFDALEVPVNANFSVWYVGQKAFIQAQYSVQGDGKYDYIKEGEKYAKVTYSYDPAKDKFEKISCPFVVEYMVGVSPYSDDYAIVQGWEISKEKRLLAATVVQTLGEDGKYWTDVQDVLPGASMILFENGKTLLINGEKAVVFEGSEEIGSFVNDDQLESYSSGIFKKYGAYYNLAGETLLRPTEEQRNDFTLNGKIYYQTQDEETLDYTLHILDAETRAETTEKVARVSGSANSYMPYYLTESGEETVTYSMKLIGADFTIFEGKTLANISIDISACKKDNAQYILVRTAVQQDASVTDQYYLVKAENVPNTLYE